MKAILSIKCIFVFLSYLLVQNVCDAQNKLPSVNILTPEAASLSSYAEVPVNYYSGIPVIGVPIYSLKSLDNQVDLSIGYHAGGIKVDEEASIIGLGWTLRAGGIITEIKGTAPDATDPGPCNTTLNNSTNSFFYSFENYSGTFYLDQAGKGIIIKQDDIDIQRLLPEGTGFKITTRGGYIYSFTEREISEASNSLPTSVWKLTSITSPSNNIISFQYEKASDYDFKGLPNTSEEKITALQAVLTWCEINGVPGTPQQNDNICYPSPEVGDISASLISTVVKVKTSYLKRVVFNKGSIEFNYEDREDLNYPGTIVPKRLKEIIINSVLNNISSIKYKYGFVYDYSDFNNLNNKESKRLRLKELRQYSAGAETYISWMFNYNTTPLPLKTTKNKDHWGFYNGPVNNQEILPVSGANREPNENYVVAGMLSSIKYPTNGISYFEFEMNDYSNRGSTGLKKGGGFVLNESRQLMELSTLKRNLNIHKHREVILFRQES